jgi:hypothetical protein
MLDVVLLVGVESVELEVETIIKVFVLSSFPFSVAHSLDTGIEMGVDVIVVDVVLYP